APSDLRRDSALMAHPAVLRPGGWLVVVSCGPFGVQPFGKNSKEARDILDNLPSVLAINIAAEAGSPKQACLFNQIVICRGRRFHPKTSRPASRRSVLLVSGFGVTPIAPDLVQ